MTEATPRPLDDLAQRVADANQWDQESLAFETLDLRIEQLVNVLRAYPHLWDIGDGYGGAVHRLIDKGLEAHGFMPPPRAERGRGARRALTWGVRYAVMERDDFTCLWCCARKALTVDHIVAVANGGTDDLDNLQTLCKRCNIVKGTS